MRTTLVKTEHLSCRIIPNTIGDFRILNDVCLEIEKQQISCLLDVSDSCSSILLQIIGGVLPCEEGTILFEEKDVSTLPISQRCRSIGYFEPTLLTGSMLRQQVGKYLSEREKSTFSMNSFKFGRIRPSLPETLRSTVESLLHKTIRELSGEEMLLLPLWAVLLREPKLLLADMLSPLLSPAISTIILATIQNIHKQCGLSVLFSTRSPQQAFHLSDRIFVVYNGCIIKIIENSDRSIEHFIELTRMVEKLRNQATPCSALTALLEEQYV